MQASDTPALDNSGNLKDANDIVFYHSETDTRPIEKARRPGRGAKLANLVAAEQQNSDGELDTAKPPAPKCTHRRSKNRKHTNAPKTTGDEDGDTDEDGDFMDDGDSSDDGSDSTSDCAALESTKTGELLPSNAEIADILLPKTAPTTGRGSGTSHKKRKRAPVIEEVEDIDSPRNLSTRTQRPSTSNIILEDASDPRTEAPCQKKAKTATKNPIYLFYEKVQHGADGSPGQAEDRHYKCYHGSRKVFTLTKSMKYNLTKMINNLKSCSPPMFRLYEALKERTSDHPITQEDIDIASGKKVLNPAEAKQYFSDLKIASENLRSAFQKQVENAQGPWDQDKFEQLIAEWIVACDQPFEEVDRAEFRAMLEYAHHPSPTLKIPHRDAIRRRIMDMGEATLESIKGMFKNEVKGKISLSLDAWTSSNNYAFLAIVAHYINQNGNAEELLINFKEILGEHSGENMAQAVWETLKRYEIEDRILAFMLDNASNNDTMVDVIVERARKEGIILNASWMRLRCMPHTIHLAAVKLLEAIGAISPNDAQKSTSRSGNYQDSVTAPLSRSSDNDAAAQDDTSVEDEVTLTLDKSSNILAAVGKLRKIVRAIRSSPQRKQAWLSQLEASFRGQNGADRQRALILILDVKTRWSSTHQMLRRALDFAKEIDDFVGRHRDLRSLELEKDDWDAISMVSGWLKAFRSATTEMSKTKDPMLSTVHAIFRGLQEHVSSILRELPDSAPLQLQNGLIEAHNKLSEYYFRSDESPFYTWAAILDPRIMYEGLKEDFSEDLSLLNDLNIAKQRLVLYYRQNYANTSARSSPPLASVSSGSFSSASGRSPEKVNFTKRYQKKDRVLVDELDEYFRLPREDFDSCHPLHWWRGRRSQFPNLYRLVCDIFSIPGSAVAVERIFSGGRDTISLRRASLIPDTIRVLMLVKQRLKLSRVAFAKKA